MRILWLAALVACGAETGNGMPDGALPDAGLPDLTPPTPFITRVTSDSNPATTLFNLTQWNWDRQLAVSEDGTVHAVWDQLATPDVNPPADRPDPVDTTQLPPGQIFYARSTDRGRTWSAPHAITGVANGNDSGAVATAGSYVYVLYRSADQGRLRVFFRASGDGGASWGAPVVVSDNPAGVTVSPPTVAAWGSGNSPSVYVAWADGRPQLVSGQMKTVKEIYLARSGDRGATW